MCEVLGEEICSEERKMLLPVFGKIETLGVLDTGSDPERKERFEPERLKESDLSS